MRAVMQRHAGEYGAYGGMQGLEGVMRPEGTEWGHNGPKGA